jgi:1-acyl-sn-glycerol-3-phosphate acyltransferase
LASAVAALRAGELVLVMPEQTISTSFDLLAFRTGAARMAALAGVPLVPAVTWGAHRFSTVGRACRPQWRLPVVASYGAPLTVDDVEDVAAATEVLRARVGDLLDAAVSGYPDGIASGAWWVPARFGGGAPAMGARPDALRRGVGHRTWAG